MLLVDLFVTYDRTPLKYLSACVVTPPFNDKDKLTMRGVVWNNVDCGGVMAALAFSTLDIVHSFMNASFSNTFLAQFNKELRRTLAQTSFDPFLWPQSSYVSVFAVKRMTLSIIKGPVEKSSRHRIWNMMFYFSSSYQHRICCESSVARLLRFYLSYELSLRSLL